MKANIAILITIATLTYFATLHFSGTAKPTINKVPDKDSINKAVNSADEMPDFTFTDINGNSRSASDYKGKIIILNFWASWCAPCIKEFPNLLNAADQHKDKAILIALSSDLNKEAIQKFITKMEKTQALNFKADNVLIALDENQAITSGKFQTFKLPETLIIDRDFKIRHKLIGADWTREDLDKIIKEIE